MRIALIGPTYPFRGGIAQHTTVLWKYLQKKHDVYFVSFSRQYPSLIFPGASDREPGSKKGLPGVNYLIDSVNPVTWINTARSIISYKPDLVIFIWWVPFFAFCWRIIAGIIRAKLNVKILYICHNVLPHENSRFWQKISLFALKSADGFIVHSSSDKNVLKDILFSAPVSVLPIAPHPEPVKRGISRSSAREKLGLPDGKTVFMFFGFVRKYKGLDILIDAMSMMPSDRAHLLIVGEFWESREKYKKMIRDRNLSQSVTIFDRYVPVNEFELFFTASDVVVLPYRDATQSGVPQLAFTMGRPVIVTDVGGLSENIISKKHGSVTEPENAEKLAQAMQAFLNFNVDFNSAELKKHAQARMDRDWNLLINEIIKLSEL